MRCHIERYAYRIEKLSNTTEGDGTVQDNSCGMFVSEHGNAHIGTRVSLVRAGGLGGPLKTGRTLDCLKPGNDKR